MDLEAIKAKNIKIKNEIDISWGEAVVKARNNGTKPPPRSQFEEQVRGVKGVRRGPGRGGHNRTHGLSLTGTYDTWKMMRQRCDNPKNRAYKNYGGRGIKYDPRWASFDLFLEDMGERPEGLTLDRIANNGDYCKHNCRWATVAQQQRNRRDTRRIRINGRTLCAKDWAELAGVSPQTVYARLNRGWGDEEAVFGRKK